MPVDGISVALLTWYDRHARTLPWRIPPGSADRPDPYAVWLSEVMLQQTTVPVAARYWRNFLDRWPDVHALARAPEADILSAWAGLGYYARARNLIAAARAISESGRFPETSAELRRLPGIGPYTAAAVAAIAFGEQVAAIDSNVARVAGRLFAISTPLPNGRSSLEQALAPHVPAARAGDFTQALMDLGSSICTPRKPRCLLCPLASMCKARALGEPESYPDRPPRKERPLRQGLAWWIECGDTVALVRRPSRGLLGGMMALPGSDWTSDPPPSPPDLEGEWAMLGEVSHGFTHFELRLSIATTRLAEPLPDLLGQKLIWTARSQLSDAGLPTLFARAAELALAATLQPLETR